MIQAEKGARKTHDGAKLSDSIISTGVDVGFCCEDINKFVLHYGTIWIEPVTGESNTCGDVVAIQLIGVVGCHCSIPLEANSTIDRKTFGEAFLSKVSQTVRVTGEHPANEKMLGHDFNVLSR